MRGWPFNLGLVGVVRSCEVINIACVSGMDEIRDSQSYHTELTIELEINLRHLCAISNPISTYKR